MKKLKPLVLFILLITFQNSYSQSLTLHDPSVKNPMIEMDQEKEGKLSFEFIQQLSDYSIQGEAQPIRMTISLMNIKLKEGVYSIKGTYAKHFNWQYDINKNYLLATQIAMLEKDVVGDIEMEYSVINTPSCKDDRRIGFNVNIQPAACMNGINKIENDHVYYHICEPLLSTSLEELSVDKYEISPNPAKSEFSIKLDQITDRLDIKILDVHGKIVYQSLFKNTKEENIDLTKFPSGSYSLLLKTKDKVATDRLIVIK